MVSWRIGAVSSAWLPEGLIPPDWPLCFYCERASRKVYRRNCFLPVVTQPSSCLSACLSCVSPLLPGLLPRRPLPRDSEGLCHLSPQARYRERRGPFLPHDREWPAPTSLKLHLLTPDLLLFCSSALPVALKWNPLGFLWLMSLQVSPAPPKSRVSQLILAYFILY